MDKSKPDDAELKFAESRAKEGASLHALSELTRSHPAEANKVEIAKMLSGDAPVADVLHRSSDALAQMLDARDGACPAGDLLLPLIAAIGATVKDQKIFRELAAKYEEEFLEDMRRLGVRPPHALTRVTEYMPEVVECVDRLRLFYRCIVASVCCLRRTPRI